MDKIDGRKAYGALSTGDLLQHLRLLNLWEYSIEGLGCRKILEKKNDWQREMGKQNGYGPSQQELPQERGHVEVEGREIYFLYLYSHTLCSLFMRTQGTPFNKYFKLTRALKISNKRAFFPKLPSPVQKKKSVFCATDSLAQNIHVICYF